MDAFAGLDGLGGSGAAKKLSLAEQLKAEEANKRKAAQAWDSLDLLDPTFQARQSHSPAIAPAIAPSPAEPRVSQASSVASGPVAQAPAAQKPAAQIADDDVFGLFSSAPPPAPQQSEQPPPPPPATSRPTSNGIRSNGARSSGSTSAASPAQSPRPEAPRRPGAASSASSASSARPRAPKASSPGFDRNLAYLIDMGFESEDASRALSAMDNQVSGAVNYLMAEAQGLPLPKPKQSASQQLASLGGADLGDFGAVATQLGTSVFSKASSLWSKGRKELEKAYSQYNGQPPSESGQPAWMRDKAKYDARKSRLERTGSSGSSASSAGSSANNSTPSSAAASSVDLASMPRARPEPSRTEDPPMPQRPSRAELFRRKQMERSSSQDASVNPRSGASTPVQTPAAGPAAPVAAPVAELVAEPVAELDLLNLGGQATEQPQLSSTQTDMYAVSRELGSDAFKKGNYESAVDHYTAALAAVPDGNVLRALLLSNRSAALMKAGNARAAYDDTVGGLRLLPNKGAGLEAEGKPMTEIWMKLVTRQAQAGEQMEKFEGALASWQLLLDNGYATPAVLDAKRRCQKALNPHTVAAAEAPAKPKAKRRGWGTTGATPSSASGKAALEKVRNEHKQIQEEEKQRDLLRDRVAGRIDAWRGGNETNLRNLLATLHTVLWEGSGWSPVAASDLVVPKRVRVVYMKAVSRTHPDKVPASAPMEVRMISESVFVTIQKAWEVFRVENSL